MDDGKIYTIPNGSHDDIFCMIGTVADQGIAPKLHPILITNDLFRDHTKVMRDPELVREWYGHYCYGHADYDSQAERLPKMSKRKGRRNPLPAQKQEQLYKDLLELAHKKSTLIDEF